MGIHFILVKMNPLRQVLVTWPHWLWAWFSACFFTGLSFVVCALVHSVLSKRQQRVINAPGWDLSCSAASDVKNSLKTLVLFPPYFTHVSNHPSAFIIFPSACSQRRACLSSQVSSLSSRPLPFLLHFHPAFTSPFCHCTEQRDPARALYNVIYISLQ